MGVPGRFALRRALPHGLPRQLQRLGMRVQAVLFPQNAARSGEIPQCARRIAQGKAQSHKQAQHILARRVKRQRRLREPTRLAQCLLRLQGKRHGVQRVYCAVAPCAPIVDHEPIRIFARQHIPAIDPPQPPIQRYGLGKVGVAELERIADCVQLEDVAVHIPAIELAYALMAHDIRAGSARAGHQGFPEQ